MYDTKTGVIMSEQATAQTTVAHDEELSSHVSIQVLTFLLDDEVYGVDIRQIQEVLEYRKVTRVPRSQPFLLGVINLRGKVVPVLDLRRLFDMTLSNITVNTCIVIIDILLDGEKVSIGVLTDAVREVVELPVTEISAPPRIGSRVNNRFISGMGKHEGDFIVILDVQKVMADEEFNAMLDAVSDEALVAEEADPITNSNDE